MESYRKSIRLYRKFLRSGAANLLQHIELPHNSLFNADRQSAIYYKELYIDQVESKSDSKLKPPPNNSTCKGCKNHFLGSRPTINHRNDLILGRIFEDFFMDFLNAEFSSLNLPLECMRADIRYPNMPDFTIKNTETREDIFYFEFKCIFRPFIMVSQKIKNAHCYSHSMTLDCNKKLEKQKKLVLEKELASKTAYLYWYDIPCIKGVFWQFSKFVYSYDLKAEKYTREKQDGDYRAGLQTGNVDKIYVPLQEMKNFNDFFVYLESLL